MTKQSCTHWDQHALWTSCLMTSTINTCVKAEPTNHRLRVLYELITVWSGGPWMSGIFTFTFLFLTTFAWQNLSLTHFLPLISIFLHHEKRLMLDLFFLVIFVNAQSYRRKWHVSYHRPLKLRVLLSIKLTNSMWISNLTSLFEFTFVDMLARLGRNILESINQVNLHVHV